MMSNLNHVPYLNRLEACLTKLINHANIPAPEIKKSMHYCLFPGGKRLRPLLAYFAGEITNAPIESLDYIASAIEMTHCYSLVHDDLPAMDDDDIRRGKPSCHKAFNEATAIQTGDALQAFAIEILLENLPRYLSPEQTIDVSRQLLKASGPSGMVSGQTLDLLKLSLNNISETEIKEIHQLKTARLIEACINMSIAAGMPNKTEQIALKGFAKHFGLLYQMQDDYLDRYQSEKLKKGRSSDMANNKTTYATIMSEQALLEQIKSHYNHAKDALQSLNLSTSHLPNLLSDFHQHLNVPDNLS